MMCCPSRVQLARDMHEVKRAIVDLRYAVGRFALPPGIPSPYLATEEKRRLVQRQPIASRLWRDEQIICLGGGKDGHSA